MCRKYSDGYSNHKLHGNLQATECLTIISTRKCLYEDLPFMSTICEMECLLHSKCH